MSKTEVITIKRRYGVLIAQLPRLADYLLEDVAKAIERDMRDHAPVDTGALQASVYRITPSYDGYSRAVAAARRRNPGVQILPKAVLPRGKSAVIAPAAAHGWYQEYGTHTMAAQPFMAQSVQAGRRVLERMPRNMKKWLGE